MRAGQRVRAPLRPSAMPRPSRQPRRLRRARRMPGRTPLHPARMQVGCGAGNTVYPLLQANPQITRVYACDFAASAVQLVKAHPDYASGEACASRCCVRQQPAQRAQGAGAAGAPTARWNTRLHAAGLARAGRVCAFVADLTRDDLCAHVPAASVDVVTMVRGCHKGRFPIPIRCAAGARQRRRRPRAWPNRGWRG